jgi:cytochrome c551/c552
MYNPDKPCGFATMDKEQHRLLASKGGRSCHAKGVGRKWTADEARIAGSIGGKKAQENKRLAKEKNGGLGVEAQTRTPMSDSLLADSMLAD